MFRYRLHLGDGRAEEAYSEYGNYKANTWWRNGGIMCVLLIWLYWLLPLVLACLIKSSYEVLFYRWSIEMKKTAFVSAITNEGQFPRPTQIADISINTMIQYRHNISELSTISRSISQSSYLSPSDSSSLETSCSSPEASFQTESCVLFGEAVHNHV